MGVRIHVILHIQQIAGEKSFYPRKSSAELISKCSACLLHRSSKRFKRFVWLFVLVVFGWLVFVDGGLFCFFLNRKMARSNLRLAIANPLCMIAVMEITVFCNNKLFLSGNLFAT